MNGDAQGRDYSADYRVAEVRPLASAIERAGSATVPGPAAREGAIRRTTVALVVPTRNEAAHVEQFVERVQAALAPFPIDWHAEMIDDSEDDTPSILRRLARRGAALEVIQRHERDPGAGPGGAVRAGLMRSRGEIVCVIDADLQHPPEILPELLASIILRRADVCVGSRYRRGGSAAGLESRWRRLAARGAGIAARWLLPSTRLTTDPGSGLFAIRREVLDSIVLRPRGSRVLAEILVRGTWHTICDVPYRFEVTEDEDVHLGTADAIAVAAELISLSREQSRLGAQREHSDRFRRFDQLRTRRRVAPAHTDLLRYSATTLDLPEWSLHAR